MTEKGWSRSALRRALGLTVVSLSLVGCVTPGMREVEAVDSSADSVTFLFSQNTGEESKRGVISCEIEGDRLSECQILDVEYK
ncbi:hypothetical protein DV096_11940 [Bradymonadaceae bacterium TMQ3]|uniref:Uncharacterized protein n=1 Tax=Lujinxingia sediminis TaxID=2480984 RepID=A0ABY0CRL8_9DELT|nr:hypothetical protein [Lujinxingia sediminis]RDV37821.1 hypothetical protein DV096_11940 [Bradymonadaceae bacterium TMQ3]RVU43224.1 hypothetical protein EA187_13525 [Lujinxingia sediminis]TXC75396.1 hypothetical protein FRC91_11815 [Bradymonadales bacterium TMQ1]